MDKNEFFREATLRICGDLQIEEALKSCLLFLQKVLPVDIMFLEYIDDNYGSMRTIAKATSSACEKLDLLTPLSEEAKQAAKLQDLPSVNNVYIFKQPEKYAISREMLKFHNITCTDLMVLILKSKNRVLGELVLITESEKYELYHAELVSSLKEPFIIAMANALRHREVLKLKDSIADDNKYLHSELRRLSGDEIIGAHFGLKDVMLKVRQVASLDSPVLLLGETGVGKDVIANAIHYSSSRSDGPFVSVNCGAIPDTLIDSELFGHEKGAFTGALAQKRGRFERAHKGTIFLDEIGELPLPAQVRLLKVLQSKEIERVGGVKTISLDIRIIAATNRNLEEMVRLNQFREDLWFRLNVFPIRIPPVRERQSDIPALIQHFVNLKSRELKLVSIPELYPGAIDTLIRYHWPGNVRELENVIERALILNPAGPLTFEHLNSGYSRDTSRVLEESTEIENLDQVVSRHIRRALTKTKGKINGPDGAANILGINPSTLRNRMKKLGIEYAQKIK
jgi:transcriptional regulator with GAF, ATPase, and Fis domain